MTQAEYDAYTARVARFFKDEGITNLTRKDDDGESFFSWRRCECCLRREGGDRVEANGYNPTTRQVQDYTVCSDCEYYAEYGQLDDMAMMDIV